MPERDELPKLPSRCTVNVNALENSVKYLIRVLHILT